MFTKNIQELYKFRGLLWVWSLREIQARPFAGYEAIFDARLSGCERVRVRLKLIIKQQIPLDLPSGQVQLQTNQTGRIAGLINY